METPNSLGASQGQRRGRRKTLSYSDLENFLNDIEPDISKTTSCANSNNNNNTNNTNNNNGVDSSNNFGMVKLSKSEMEIALAAAPVVKILTEEDHIREYCKVSYTIYIKTYLLTPYFNYITNIPISFAYS